MVTYGAGTTVISQRISDEEHMPALGNVRIGMSAEMTATVSREMTVGHFVAGMPQVYATPMMILHMEMASGSAIAAHLLEGFVSVGMNVRAFPGKAESGIPIASRI